MLIGGIIAEYNPFHNGHRYQMERTREAGATHIVAVMSGNFVQRAEPAVVGKFCRAKAAVLSGADLVAELPLAYATAASERFAFGAVSLLSALGCVDMLSFGSESGDIGALSRAADAVADPKVKKRIRQLTEMGESYPAAQTKALQVFYPDIAGLTKTPNNILGIDYLRALKKQGDPMTPFTVRRAGAEHDGAEPDGGFASAGFLREQIRKRGKYTRFMPRESELELLDATVAGRISGGMKMLESAVLMKLRQMEQQDFHRIPDAESGMGDRLYHAAAEAATLEELYELGKTKRYTMSRVRRAVLAALLGITEQDYIDIPYIRLLAIGEKGEDILRAMKKKCALPVSGSLKELTGFGGLAARAANKEAAATDIYNLSLYRRAPKGEDFTARLFRV